MAFFVCFFLFFISWDFLNSHSSFFCLLVDQMKFIAAELFAKLNPGAINISFEKFVFQIYIPTCSQIHFQNKRRHETRFFERAKNLKENSCIAFDISVVLENDYVIASKMTSLRFLKMITLSNCHSIIKNKTPFCGKTSICRKKQQNCSTVENIEI